MRPEPFKKWTRPARLRLRLGRHLPAGLHTWHLKMVAGVPSQETVEIVRNGRAIELRLGELDQIEDDRIHYYYREFLPVIVFLFSRTAASVKNAIANLHDGSTTASNHLVFSGSHPGSVLVPDPEFFNSNGYAKKREKLREQRPWHERDEGIVWRGSTTGSGRLAAGDRDYDAPDVRQRIRMCAILKALPNVDAKIHSVVQLPNSAGIAEQLKQAGIFGDHVPALTWLDRKFAIDIDGNANAWSNLFTRLLYGCCVIKIASPHNFRQWYYDRMAPWQHFVPVRADMTDLVERVEWCRSHPAECRKIAAAGQELALSMTFDAETRFAIETINRRLG